MSHKADFNSYHPPCVERVGKAHYFFHRRDFFMKGIGFKTFSMMVCAVFFLAAFNHVEGSKEIMENEKEVMKDDDGFSFPTKTSNEPKQWKEVI